MSHTPLRSAAIALFSVSALVWASAADAQNSGLLDGLFGGADRPPRGVATGQSVQMSDADLVMRLDRLENQLRQLTGAVEQLQFRNQQLEQQLRRSQEDTEFRFQELTGGRSGARPAPTVRPQPSSPPPAQAAPTPSGRRSDAFDPTLHPNAPGAPRPLGGGSGPVITASPPPVVTAAPASAEPAIGAPGGRDPGQPLDLTTMARRAAAYPSLQPAAPATLPPPPPSNPSATGPVASLSPPTASPKDEFELGQQYVRSKNYALAEQTFRNFLQKYPDDRLAPEAHYWLGESLFQRQRYRDAAEQFLTVSTKYETSGKAPDSLLRLGQALAALGETETACAALGEVNRKYPRASVAVKQGVEREQKRVRC